MACDTVIENARVVRPGVSEAPHFCIGIAYGKVAELAPEVDAREATEVVAGEGRWASAVRAQRSGSSLAYISFVDMALNGREKTAFSFGPRAHNDGNLIGRPVDRYPSWPTRRLV